jgi:acetyl-CoA C-acetyltransferase
MSAASEAFLYDAIRTPRGKGKPTGALHEVKPIQLITGLLTELRERHPELDPATIDDVVLGVVTPIGDQGMDIARTAVLAAGYPETTGGVQLNRFCASGLEAVNQAAQRVRSGWEDFILAGGVESMSRVPMGSDGGAWAMDPETALATGFIPQGISADLIATLDGFSRTDVDTYAAESHARAAKAWANGYFARSVVPVTDRNGLPILDHDQLVRPGVGDGVDGLWQHDEPATGYQLRGLFRPALRHDRIPRAPHHQRRRLNVWQLFFYRILQRVAGVLHHAS